MISDEGAIEFMLMWHSYRSTPTEIAAVSLNAGCNLELSDDMKKPFYFYLSKYFIRFGIIFYNWLINFNDMSTYLVISCLVVMESHSLYIHIFCVVISLEFLLTVLWYQVFLSNTNNLHTVLWYQVFLSNTNNLHTVLWYQVFLSNTNNLHSSMVSNIPI